MSRPIRSLVPTLRVWLAEGLIVLAWRLAPRHHGLHYDIESFLAQRRQRDIARRQRAMRLVD